MTLSGLLIGFLLTIHVIVSVLLVLLVLMQRPKSEGLGTAFGGGVADSLFGSGAGNVL
ncbi:MAG: preprotein translocase subunit SecG, partial [Verrucomicrobiae bacterium]|nr:preprotein translocase subunit SecG [Verrucomicrobiae bacterium]